MNIKAGRDITPQELCKALLDIAGPDRAREVVWRYEDESVDVPDDIGQVFLDQQAVKADSAPRPRKRGGRVRGDEDTGE